MQGLLYTMQTASQYRENAKPHYFSEKTISLKQLPTK